MKRHPSTEKESTGSIFNFFRILLQPGPGGFTCITKLLSVSSDSGLVKNKVSNQIKAENEVVNKSELNTFLRDSAFRSEYRKILGFVNSSEIVSTDFYSSEFASVIDAQATIADGKKVTLYCWYDNEYGYSKQVLNLTRKIAHIELPILPLSIN